VSRILAIDYGSKRIGLAISDPTRTIASPLTTLYRREGKRPPWAELERVVHEQEVAGIVVGLPVSLAGEDTPWTAEVREFAARLAERTGVPVDLQDERLTSVQAEAIVRGSGLPRRKREDRSRVDSAAAALILQTYLQRLRPS
jgi:putative Holliday junction resolvase